MVRLSDNDPSMMTMMMRPGEIWAMLMSGDGVDDRLNVIVLIDWRNCSMCMMIVDSDAMGDG